MVVVELSPNTGNNFAPPPEMPPNEFPGPPVVAAPAAESASQVFLNLFESIPQPARQVLDAALKLDKLRDLHAQAALGPGAPFSRAVLDLLDVHIHVDAAALERFPAFGPLVIIANHPFGILDGLVLDALLCRIRSDIKILTNSLIATASGIRERCIAVEVFKSRTASGNLKAVRAAREWLSAGHGITIFPAGEVSHWQREESSISDPPWSNVATRLALNTEAPVVPVYVVGSNSLVFQIAGLVHPRMRTARLPRELLNKRGRTIEVRVANPIAASELSKFNSPDRATAYLRARTYMLRHRKQGSCEASPRCQDQSSVAAPLTVSNDASRIAGEITHLDRNGCKVFENACYAVFADRGDAMPLVLREIGALREQSFRAVGEGTGTTLDLDRFDPDYTQLVLWHKQKRCIAGGYRLAWTDDILSPPAGEGLYTSTLFRFAPGFSKAIGPAVELGRAFVCPEFQKDYAPLLSLWQAIGRCVAARPSSPVLFGPVSLSASYSEAAIELMIEFLRARLLRPDLARFVSPRSPFRSRLTRAAEIRQLAGCLSKIEELETPLSDIQNGSHVPVLLRQYVRLGGRIAAFNVDRKFANVIDALLVVDLRETSPKLLAKYMGQEAATRFLLEV